MFQLWKLLLLCHLLSGTSAGLLFNFGHGLSNLVDRVKPVLHNGLETIGHRSEGFLNLNSRVPQNFIAKKKIPRTKKVVDLVLPYVHPSLENIFGVKISKTVIRDIQAEWAADGRSINLRFLVTANVTATLSLVCKRVNLEVFLDLLTRIGLVPVPQTSLFTVVVGEFTADPASIKVSLLDRANDTINKAMNSTNGVLKMVFSALLQKQLCPWIQSSLDGLQVSSLEDIYAGLQHAVALQVSI